MGRRKRSKIQILISFDCLLDIFPFCLGDLQLCQNFSLVNRLFFLVAKKYLYKYNPRIISAIYLRSEFKKCKFIYHIPFKWTTTCGRVRNYGPDSRDKNAYHWGRKCCQKVPLPEVSPPANILGFDNIIIEDFVGRYSESYKFLRCSKRLFAGRKCLLNIYDYRRFLKIHTLKRLGELITIFRQCSSLAVAYSESWPQHYEFLITRLLHCDIICLTYCIRSYWDELHYQSVANYAKLAIGNLLFWLHHKNGAETQIRMLFSDSSDLIPIDYQKNPSRDFNVQFYEAIKKKFLVAKEPCTFCIHMEYHYYNIEVHHYDTRAAANRDRHGDGILEWVYREENERTGEVLEHFIYSEMHNQRQHRILRRRSFKCEDQKLISLSRIDYPTMDKAEFDTKIYLIQPWRRKCTF